jgi:periplasmic protein TonB
MKLRSIAGKLVVGLLLSAVVIPPALRAEELTHRFSEEAATKSIKSKVNPEYPPIARQMKLGGTVQLDVYVDTDGTVEKVEVVRGNALLTSAAVTALKRWKFSPFTSEGKAIKAVAAFTLTFKL